MSPDSEIPKVERMLVGSEFLRVAAGDLQEHLQLLAAGQGE